MKGAMNMTITDELLQTLNQLNEAQQQRLLNFARILANTSKIQGESGKSIVQATGFFDADALEEIEAAIVEAE
jgi:hypothetical protein